MDAAEQRRIQRRKYREDPMIPVQGHVLKAMIDLDPRSVNELAKLLGEEQQTLQSIVSGKTSKVRRSRLEKLADALGMPVDWFSKPHAGIASLSFNKFVMEASGTVEQPESKRGRHKQVTLKALRRNVDEALKRDLATWFGKGADEAYETWGRGVLLAINELASPKLWREAAILPYGPMANQGGQEERRTQKARAKESETHALPTDEGAAWVHQVIEPWLLGSAFLNAHVLSLLLVWFFKNPIRVPSDADREVYERNLIVSLVKYEKAQEKYRTAGRAD